MGMSEAVKNEGDTARANRLRIARLLGLRHNWTPISPEIQRRFHSILLASAAKPDVEVFHRLEGLKHSINRPDKGLDICLVLLDRLWMLPPQTRVQRDVIAFVQSLYHQVSTGDRRHSFLLNEELRQRQWSASAIIRQVACQVREAEPADSDEIKKLRSPGETYPELRVSIAERAILHRQKDYFGPVLDYMISVMTERTNDDFELQNNKRLFGRLSDVPMHLMLPPLYQRFVTHFDNSDIRGYMLPVLSGYGSALVTQLAAIYRERDADHGPIVRLLRFMAAHGQTRAADALVAILLEGGARYELELVSEALVRGFQELSRRGIPDWVQPMVDYLPELLMRLETGALPIHRDTVKKLRAISWNATDAADVTELVEKFLAGEVEVIAVRPLRHSRQAFRLFAVAAESIELGDEVRHRAIQALTLFRSRGFKTTAVQLAWRIYQQAASSDALRCEALRCMAKVGGEAADETRQRLAKDYRVGADAIKRTIVEVWPSLFQSPLPDPN